MTLIVKPAPRWCASMAELPSSSELVLFGGKTTSAVYTSGSNTSISYGGILGDTWTFNGTSFTFVSNTGGPSNRYDSAMSYDGTYVTLVGGTDGIQNLSDTWNYSASAGWSQVVIKNTISASGTYAVPSWLSASSMAYNSSPTGTLLFGGNASYQRHYVLDSWEYTNPASWSELSPTSWPNGREYAAMASNGSTQLLFGGKSFDGPLADTWTFASGAWTQTTGLKIGTTSPPARYGASMAYDASTSQFVLFGGVTAGGYYDNTTWTYSTGTNLWTQQIGGPTPPARAFASMAYLTASTAVIMFGGLTPIVDLNDTWSWSGTWSLLG